MRQEPEFDIAIALTSDHALMACGFLAKLREFHPHNGIFIITDEKSVSTASNIAEAFNALEVVVTTSMGFNCLEWGEIVTSKFVVFNLPTNRPVVFLDIDQVITRDINVFVREFVDSGVLLAGGADDEPLRNQFQSGKIPEGLNGSETVVVNTGAFITRPNKDFFDLILRSIPKYSGTTRLPTQGLINGILYEENIPFKVYGDDFMIGPFNKHILDNPCSAALLHLWTPRPPFMFPNPKRVGVDGDLTWDQCVKDFEMTNLGVRYPICEIEYLYLEQMYLFESKFGSRLSSIERPAGHRKCYEEFVALYEQR